ncbi:MAG: hypothetical protein JEZ03_05380 [Bacteroidales bacterium]|nr:hypothetical protein [Bacteroidales bacterium]
MAEVEIRLQENETYLFEIIRTVVLPGEEECFVLKDPFGKRHLLMAEFYRDYGFSPGKKIRCKVDKVNCNGKIFLEPEHPHYEESKVYDFEVVAQNKLGNYNGVLFSVKDIFKNVYQVFSPVRQNLKDRLKCKVNRIKKGQLHLFALAPGAYNRFEKGQKYPFSIKEVIRLEGGFKYYLLEGPFKYNHLLDYTVYSEFGLTVGAVVNCTIIDRNADGELVIQPDHPNYSIGEIYDFRFMGYEEVEDPLRGLKKFLYVIDSNDYEHSILLDNEKTEDDFTSKIVKCRLDRLKKAKLFLTVVE